VLLLLLPAYARVYKSEAWARSQFAAAQRLHQSLEARPAQQLTGADYERVINAYHVVYFDAPSSTRADPSVVAVAQLKEEMGRRFEDDDILRAAIEQYRAEGGLPARLSRYTENCAALVSGMRALGFKTFLPDALQAPIIVTFHAPPDPAYDFKQFYDRVRDRGFILYPGKLTAVDTFRVGCIGAIGPGTLKQAVAAVADVLRGMGVRRLA